MNLLIMQSSPASCIFIPLRSKYSTQNPVLTHPQSMFLLSVTVQASHPYKTTGKIIVLFI